MLGMKTINPVFNAFTDEITLLDAMSLRIVSSLTKAIRENKPATLAVSGGRSPKRLFQRLAKADLAWEEVTITLIDERWVANDHCDSNEKLVRDYLLQDKAAMATLIPLKNSASTPLKGERLLEASLSALPEKITVSVLGMGEDGHTASFFPHATTLTQALSRESGRACQSITPKTAAHSRMTLTLPRILASEEIILHISGQPKKAVYDRAVTGADSVFDLPVKSVLHQPETPVMVYWAPT
jgi:6-phosphogluconolactonase